MITKNNLKILATIFCYLVRLVNDNTNKFMVYILSNLSYYNFSKIDYLFLIRIFLGNGKLL
jgi:hypothetical protein